jgi:uncharacterized protein (TIGR02646 family)
MSINIIENPYIMRPEDLRVIHEHFSGDHHVWDNKNDFEDFKDNFRRVIRLEQEKRCCYCKSYLKLRKQNVDIEHIIPKSKQQQFTFYPQNLALSCKRCNSVKSIHNPFDANVPDHTIVDYPTDPLFYNMIHPHFDEYFVNINILENVIIVASTPKGWKTVERCALYEPELAMDKAKEELHNTDSIKDVFMRVIMGVNISEDSEERLLHILRNLDEI